MIGIFARLSHIDPSHILRVDEDDEAIFRVESVALRKFLPLGGHQEFVGRIDKASLYYPQKQGVENIVTLRGIGKVLLAPELSS